MGGTVAVTLRTENGEEHRMARWTNIFPAIVHNLDFLSGDLGYWNEILERFYEMRKDWEESQMCCDPESFDFKYPMSSCYGYWNCLAPEGYGLIVLDQKEKQILSMQGYTSFGDFITPSISMALDWDNIRKIENGDEDLEQCLLRMKEKEEDNYAVDFYELQKEGRIVGIERLDNDAKNIVLDRFNGDETLEEVFAPVITTKRSRFSRYVLDLSPYEIVDFEEDSEGAIEFRKRILELGFILSDEEEKFWDEWINRKLKDEQEYE